MPITRDTQYALKRLMAGDLVAIPTETVYGLAGWITNEKAIEQIFSLKKRPFFDPLIVHIKDHQQARQLSLEWTELHDDLAKLFWPGPLTIITKKNDLISPLITSGLDTVGLRVPQHPMALEILQSLPYGFAAPSANQFMKTSPTRAEDVIQELGDNLLVLDGGPCEVGIESTIIEPDLHGKNAHIKILRPGVITSQMIQEKLEAKGYKVTVEMNRTTLAPGQFKHHYMPTIPMFIQTDEKEIDPLPLWGHIQLQRIAFWKMPSDPKLAARLLYQKFRELSALPLDAFVVQISHAWYADQNWDGVLNRLEKAQFAGKEKE